MQIVNLFICPFCHAELVRKKNHYHCRGCKKNFFIKSDIPNFLTTETALPSLKTAQIGYEKLHQKPWDHLRDGSYEIVARFARGNKTVDIACGDGFIEELVPTTVGVDFSFNALYKAKKRGARYLVQAAAESLPFNDNSFDLSVCLGSLEHFADPSKAILEMVRVSTIQLLTVHSSVWGHDFFTKLLGVKHQPIEHPLRAKQVETLLKTAGAHVVFKGVWTLPVNYGRVITWLPELHFIPSSQFIISIKQ